MLISAKVDFAAMFIIELLKITFWYNLKFNDAWNWACIARRICYLQTCIYDLRPNSPDGNKPQQQTAKPADWCLIKEDCN